MTEEIHIKHMALLSAMRIGWYDPALLETDQIKTTIIEVGGRPAEGFSHHFLIGIEDQWFVASRQVHGGEALYIADPIFDLCFISAESASPEQEALAGAEHLRHEYALRTAALDAALSLLLEGTADEYRPDGTDTLTPVGKDGRRLQAIARVLRQRVKETGTGGLSLSGGIAWPSVTETTATCSGVPQKRETAGPAKYARRFTVKCGPRHVQVGLLGYREGMPVLASEACRID